MKVEPKIPSLNNAVKSFMPLKVTSFVHKPMIKPQSKFYF